MIIAVDPGANGAIAWCTNSGAEVNVVKMPETRGDTIALIRRIYAKACEPTICYHEKVANFIPDGGASQMMSFGRSAERCACIAETLGIPLVEIPPKEWQKLLNLGSSERKSVPKAPSNLSKGEAKSWKIMHADEIKAAKTHNATAKREWKNKLKATAQQRHPSITVTLGTADALLILDASFRYGNGGPPEQARDA